ncbi:MAG: hypothetical protein F6K30_00800 [Cyanothece sp. SIO2G6]|nr:hypothetical protein [Cyanothece sp. SIO2G6]
MASKNEETLFEAMTQTQSANPSQLSALQRAALALAEMRTRLDALEAQQTEPIAIVGMGCRFPGGSDDPQSFWDFLREGHDGVRDIPADRWPIDQYYDADPEACGKMSTRRGGFLHQVDQFDANFFDISPREAASLDPQQRLLLELSWEALEQAAIAPDRLRGTQAGVFIGISFAEYLQLLMAAEHNHPGDNNIDNIDVYTATGNALSVAAGRLAYSLGLQGPTLAVDTACSSSLVSVHLACQSLRLQECDLALAGGVYLMLFPYSTIAMTKLKALSGEGRCKAFDAAADGYVRSEGGGVVVLKRLSDAIAARDPILAVIRGSAVNQDGRSSALTVPNGLAQEAVIRAALANAKVEAKQISYVETHGTGTPLGDPVEIRALNSVFGGETRSPLQIGSVKTNVGHLEAGAGITSLIKVVQMLRHQEIPPHLNFQQLNPHIAEINPKIEIPTTLTPWQGMDENGNRNGNGHRFAGVSSFGFSGTNAHTILEEFVPEAVLSPELGSAEPAVTAQLFTLSAKTETALKALAHRWTTHLQQHADVRLVDVCFTANVGRSDFEHRLAIVAESMSDLCQALKVFATGEFGAGKNGGGKNGGGKNGGGKAVLLSSSETLDATVQPQGDPTSAHWLKLAQRYIQGETIDWQQVDWPDDARRIPLPTYVFQRQRHWLDIAVPFAPHAVAPSVNHHQDCAHPLLGQKLSSPLSTVQFQSQWSLNELPLVPDHQLGQLPVLNLVLYLEPVIAAFRDYRSQAHPNSAQVSGNLPNRVLQFSQVDIFQALAFPDQNSITVQLTLEETGSDRTSFQWFSYQPGSGDTGEWKRHMGGMLALEPTSSETIPIQVNPLELSEQYHHALSAQEFYQQVDAKGAQLGPQCQLLTQVWRRNGAALGKITCPSGAVYLDRVYVLPMGGIDAALQLIFATLPIDFAQGYVLVGCERFNVYDYPAIPTHQPINNSAHSRDYWGQASLTSDISAFTASESQAQGVSQPPMLSAEIRLFNAEGQLIVEILGIQLKCFKPESFQKLNAASQSHPRPSTDCAERSKSTISSTQVETVTAEKQQAMLETYLVEAIANSLKISSDQIQPQQSLATVLDSLMAMEIKSQITRDFQINVAMENFLGENTITTLATRLSERLTIASLNLSSTETNDSAIETAENTTEIIL